ncbi:Solute carrier family 2, facilitated glucose transporter member 1 [Eumeta japonica]|uniref:Solute carrier family 2, facilitated glucose transporter member 1 n=1 Tax=Eumeta variegata TaxID=151549 RepID=A0A4C1ZFP6_EUMVA|nr:Solute carrier family 2, facilitated glucose transporter member 1 [Eumeta japonica]
MVTAARGQQRSRRRRRCAAGLSGGNRTSREIGPTEGRQRVVDRRNSRSPDECAQLKLLLILFGRKGGLLLNNVLVLVGVAFEASAKAAASFELFTLGRLLIGVNSGLNAGLAPMYLAEISPVSLRGSICTVYQLVITITILLSQILGHKSILGTDSLWPWLFAVTALPAVLQGLTLPYCPESPKYLLLNKGQELEAQRALNWLRGDAAVHGEMEEMHQEAEKNKISKKVTIRELLTNRQLRQPLLIGVVVMIAQQLSGINAVIFYSTTIFDKANLDNDEAQYGTIGIGAMNVVMTLVSLLLVELAGRKTLLLTGFTGMFVSTVFLTVAMIYTSPDRMWLAYVCIVLVVIFVSMFAVGPGSIPWFLVTELFNQSSRPAATAVAVTVNWTANFVVGLSFLPLSDIIKHYVFVIFAAIQALCIIFIILKVPETKNKTVEEITAMFRQRI